MEDLTRHPGHSDKPTQPQGSAESIPPLSQAHPLVAVGVQAFAKHALTLDEWNTHLHQALIPAIRQTSLDITPTSTPKPRRRSNGVHAAEVASRVTEIVLSTTTEQSLAVCSAACKSAPLRDLQVESGIEYVIQPTRLLSQHEHPGLAVFDMDSTLIQQEVIDELARAVGLYDKVAAITEAAMRGEPPYTDFETSLRARVALLKGVPTSIWDQLKTSTITFTPGAKELVRALKCLGWKTAVLSGGFTPLANWVKDTLGLDYAHANHLIADEESGVLTGQLVPGKPIIHAEKKRELLLEIAAKEGIPLERVIAVGDGSNDLKMMEAAGLGIAFNAKPKVQDAAPARLNSDTLLDVMYILGYTTRQIESVLAGDKSHASSIQ